MMKLPATIIVFLLLSCLGTNQIQNATNQVNDSQDNGTIVDPQNQTIVPDNNATDIDLEFWMNITNDNVETACLNQAKNFAGAQAFAVTKCECEETVSEERKTYGCSIKTLDITQQYFANIDCFLLDNACMIQTNYGSQTITFEQLQELQSQ
ncbi:MAG: hypothetical protein ABIH76_03385 [Candidatus Bathyarchaeota archaeon]